jgi:glycine cleavage system aminomethyltransferase T
LVIQDGYVPPSGDAILVNGEQVGETTSAAFGYTIGKAITLGYLPIAMAQEGVQVQILDSGAISHDATVSQRSVYDPKGLRLRS